MNDSTSSTNILFALFVPDITERSPIIFAVGYTCGSIEGLDLSITCPPTTKSTFCFVHLTGFSFTSSTPNPV